MKNKLTARLKGMLRMKKMNNEFGLSLPELLATFVIMSIISVIAFSIILSSFKTYERVNIEEKLRDEADIIMAHLVGNLFTTKESDIVNKHMSQNSAGNYYVELKDGDIVGFFNGEVYSREGKLTVLQDEGIRLGEKTKIEQVSKTGFFIQLNLVHEKSSQTLTTISEVGIIPNGT